jgi:hypothetical protein
MSRTPQVRVVWWVFVAGILVFFVCGCCWCVEGGHATHLAHWSDDVLVGMGGGGRVVLISKNSPLLQLHVFVLRRPFVL